MYIRSFVFNKRLRKLFLFIIILVFLLLSSLLVYFSFSHDDSSSEQEGKSDDFIKWVDFNVTCEAMKLTSSLDIESHNNNSATPYNWIELLAYLACKNGGDFKNFKSSDLDNLVNELNSGKTMQELTSSMKYYSYYFEAYSAVLGGFIGNYSIDTSNSSGDVSSFENKYGLKAFLPIAKNYSFSHYDDFGNSRSYGFKRVHLGNDLMGSIGTPIIAVESGVIEHLGWNQYGGWRVGIRSFDGKRYYYYAHLRKNHPYVPDLQEGSTVTAGDVIGYLGMTGYSIKENVNNINVPHLHFGMQLIFDESQVDNPNEIWIDVYEIIEFLKQNRSEVVLSNPDTRDYSRKIKFMDSINFE